MAASAMISGGVASDLRRSPRRGRWLWLGLALGLAACGSTDNQPTAAESAFCNGLLSFDAVTTPGGAEPPTPAAMQVYANQVAAAVGTLQSRAPATIAGPVRTVAAAVDKARAGDVGALGDEYAVAKAKVEEWAYENCGFQRLAMTAGDYRYRDLPSSLKAGKTAIRLQNDGREPHIALWFKRQPGDNRPTQEALGQAMGELAAANFDPARARALGFIDGDPAGAPPGGTGGTTVNLAPGRYVVFCPIPIQGNENSSHVEHGMLAELTVS